MPATYAHYRFGCDVLKQLNGKYHLSDKHNLELFMIGLHGPDILFYYHPFTLNAIRIHGSDLHKQIASSFFARSLSIVNSYDNPKERAAAIAYICGVICHYSLDKTAHPYIYDLTDQTKFLHSEIESEFDRYLLTSDGYEAVGKILTEHIKVSIFNAKIIMKFYPVIENESASLKVLKSFVFYNNMLSFPDGAKRKFVLGILRFSGNYASLSKLMISLSPNKALEESNIELKNRYEQAIPIAVKLINEFEDNLNGSLPLNIEYNHTFGRD